MICCICNKIFNEYKYSGYGKYEEKSKTKSFTIKLKSIEVSFCEKCVEKILTDFATKNIKVELKKD